MALELLVGLESKLRGTLDGEALAEAATVAELCEVVTKQRLSRPSLTQTIVSDEDEIPLVVP
jgi:hypothetical protein